MVMPNRLEVTAAAAEYGSGLAVAVAQEVGEGEDAATLALAGQAVSGAVSWVEGHAGISVNRRTYRAWYRRPGGAPLWLAKAGAVDADTLAVQGDGNDIEDVELWRGGLVSRMGLTDWLAEAVRVDYTVGWWEDGLPWDLRQAIVGLAALYMTRRDRQPGVVTVDTGGVARLVFGDGNVPAWVVDIAERYRSLAV